MSGEHLDSARDLLIRIDERVKTIFNRTDRYDERFDQIEAKLNTHAPVIASIPDLEKRVDDHEKWKQRGIGMVAVVSSAVSIGGTFAINWIRGKL